MVMSTSTSRSASFRAFCHETPSLGWTVTWPKTAWGVVCGPVFLRGAGFFVAGLRADVRFTGAGLRALAFFAAGLVARVRDARAGLRDALGFFADFAFFV